MRRGAGARSDDVRGAAVIVAVQHGRRDAEADAARGHQARSGDIVVAMGPAEAMDSLEEQFSPAVRDGRRPRP